MNNGLIPGGPTWIRAWILFLPFAQGDKRTRELVKAWLWITYTMFISCAHHFFTMFIPCSYHVYTIFARMATNPSYFGVSYTGPGSPVDWRLKRLLYDIPPASAKENRHTRTVFPHAVFLDINIISNTLTYISQTIYLYIYIQLYNSQSLWKSTYHEIWRV